jgi:hypothetical protein
MRMMLKRNWVGRLFVHALCVAFLCLTCEGAKAPASAAERGTATSDDAAGLEGRDGGGGAFSLRGWRPTSEFMARSALSDTTEVEFPDEQQDGEKHLVRDVAVFVMVAAFVGFFIAEVFLKTEADETPDDDGGGKIIPSASLAH